MHLRSSRRGRPIPELIPIIRRSQRLRHEAATPQEAKIDMAVNSSTSTLKKVGGASRPRIGDRVDVDPSAKTPGSKPRSPSDFRIKRKIEDSPPSTKNIKKSNTNPNSGGLKMLVPIFGLEYQSLFSNFFNKCVQCDEDFLTHIRLKFLQGGDNNTDFKSQKFIHDVAIDSVEFVKQRSCQPPCSHNILFNPLANPSSSDGCLESLVKVEIVEGDNIKLEPFPVDTDQKVPSPPRSLAESSSPSTSHESIADVKVIGFGQSQDESTPTITFRFKKTSDIQGSSTGQRVIIRRPGRRQLPPEPSVIPSFINGVDVEAFKAKLDNLRMCGICNYPANGMQDLNMHQLLAHSLGKGKNYRGHWAYNGPQWPYENEGKK